ncbi:transcriptional regulator [Streptomyces sp. F-3]|uniref:ROK family transcriptional regulator n=1 Tax=Streptomyces thermogriseus TaxID=75292 RepID=A0ABN1T0L3_9ACTN|nr:MULTISPECIES: ROK family transcriptional regulator [unclassified Streptomyces]MDN5383530.1 ROK family transcriptional regulator [Streptomyces sp. LB8]GAT83851.1 transcriptional regulator [Streptomyces sp. F-3]
MPASPSTARAINDRLALRLLQQEGPLTAGQLKQLTGLSRPTVADLVERLTASGLITVVGEAKAQRRGPNARLYGIAADRAHLAALDVRTGGVTVAVADLLGRELAEAHVPIGGDTGTGDAVEHAVALVERAAEKAGVRRLHTVGMGAPGLVDPVTGELRNTTSLPEWHRRLVAALQERLPHARVTVENETNLAALAEQRDGAARDRDTFALLWLGQGTGAAVVLDGTLRRGASGGTGEIGFLPVPGTGGLPSATDCAGGFHSLAGAAAVAELAAEHGLPAKGDGREPAAAEQVRAAAAAEESWSGGGPAARFLDALADRVVLGVASVVAVLDPGCVVLGGEVGQAGGEALAARVEERLARLSPLPTQVRASFLGGGAVLRGALLTARERVQSELLASSGPATRPPRRAKG